MAKIDRVLKKVFPGRDTFTEDEKKLAQRCIEAANADAARSRMPRSEYAVGETFEKAGATLKVIARPRGIHPSEACSGCFFISRNCYGLKCSKFDRSDETFVWFVEE